MLAAPDPLSCSCTDPDPDSRAFVLRSCWTGGRRLNDTFVLCTRCGGLLGLELECEGKAFVQETERFLAAQACCTRVNRRGRPRTRPQFTCERAWARAVIDRRERISGPS